MFSAILSFIASHILYFALHLESSSFPKPLTAREEIAAFEAYKAGDMEAREDVYKRQQLAGGQGGAYADGRRGQISAAKTDAHGDETG